MIKRILLTSVVCLSTLYAQSPSPVVQEVEPAPIVQVVAPTPAPVAQVAAPVPVAQVAAPVPVAQVVAPAPAPVVQKVAPAPVAQVVAPTPAPVVQKVAPAPAPVVKVAPPQNLAPQNEEDLWTPQTLSKSNGGGYGAIGMNFSQIADKVFLLMDARGGFIINHSFVIGIKGVITMSRPDIGNYITSNDTVNNLSLGLGYGGLMLEYLIMPEGLFNATIGTSVNIGSISYLDKDEFINSETVFEPNVDSDSDKTLFYDQLFVVEPYIDLNLTLAANFKVGLYASYRIVRGATFNDIDENDLSGFSTGFVAKFGVF